MPSTCIPSIVLGQNAIKGPPEDWLSPTGKFGLDDPRWCGAHQRTFGGGTSKNANFGAIYANADPALGVIQQYIYLAFRVPFAQSIPDQWDRVYLGLGNATGTAAILINLKAHVSGPTSAGKPWTNSAPNNLGATPKVWTWDSTNNKWKDLPTGALPPTWIFDNARAWVHNTDASDPNDRWAIQLRIPNGGLTNTGGTCAAPGPGVVVGITDDCGPNLGNDFKLWYFIQGGTSTSAATIYGDILEATANSTTTGALLITGTHPVPTSPGPGVWPDFHLSTGALDPVCPASSTGGGVALYGSDILVDNSDGLIHNGVSNTFIVRPRNYTGTDILNSPVSKMNATFRIANWGSSATNGDPEATPNWGSATWTYIQGNDALHPVPAGVTIKAISVPANPTQADGEIRLSATMSLGSGMTRHQCILVTLSGTDMLFLNDSAFKNLWYDKASTLAREAEISIAELTPFSSQPRDVYLAIEKMNLPRNTPSGTNEGRFLSASMQRLIAQGGELAEKLKSAQTQLSDQGDYGSSARLESLLGTLRRFLAEVKYRDQERGLAALSELIQSLSQWLGAVKQDDGAAKRLARLFNALADWLFATGLDAAAKLFTFISQLSQWLSALDNDPASAKYAPVVARALRVWLSTLADGGKLGSLIELLEGWLNSDRLPGQLAEIIKAISEFLSALSTADPILRNAVATFSEAAARWLQGYERLDTFVRILSDVGLTEDETDQLFPTFHVHAYHDTGERVTGSDGNQYPVLRAQSSFGLHAYHEGELDGWQTSIQGAQRIADNLYLIAVPNNGAARVNVRVQAVTPGEDRIPEDPIVPIPSGGGGAGCCGALAAWLDTKGPIGKILAAVARFFCQLLGRSKT